MPTMTTRVVNATFESTDEREFDTVDDAFRAAVTAGVEIAAAEITAGSTSAIVEVAVDLSDRRDAARGAVAISTARFLDPAT